MNHRNTAFLQYGLLVGTLIIYLSFLTKNYYWDGITFAQTIENAASLNASLIHPNHLLYEVLGYILYRVTHAIGIDVRALIVLQVFNCVLGSTSVVFLFRLLKRVLDTNYLAAVLAILFAFSATWWKFTTDANAYIPSILLLIINFTFVLPSKRPRPFLVGSIHALSMCFHQLAVFFFPVAVLGIYFQTRNNPDQKYPLSFVKYGVSAFILTIATYVVCFRLQIDAADPSGIVAWITNHSSENGFVFNLLESLSYSVGGLFKLFLGGRFGFLSDMYAPTAAILVTVLFVSIAAFVVQITKIWRSRSQLTKSSRSNPSKQVLLMSIVWVGIYMAFLFIWIPKNTFYRMFFLPPLILIIGILFADLHPRRRIILALSPLVLAIALANFTFYIFPNYKVRAETPLALALDLHSVWTDRTVIYYAEMNTDNQLVQYFNPSTTWKQIQMKKPDEIERELERNGSYSNDIWVETTAVKTIGFQPERLGDHSCDGDQMGLNTKAYNIMFQRLRPKNLCEQRGGGSGSF
jgi:hypothetical protein